MTPEKRKFNKVMKARKRRAAYLKSKGVKRSTKIDVRKFTVSLPKTQARKKESIFQRMKKKIF